MPSPNDEFVNLGGSAYKELIIKTTRHIYIRELEAVYCTMSHNHAYLAAIGMLQAANQLVAAVLSEENYRLWYNGVTDMMIEDQHNVSELRTALAKDKKPL